MGMLISGDQACELLFKVQTEGAESVDKLAASVRGVQSATVASAEGLSNLDGAIAALTTAVRANTEALAGMEGGFQRTTTAATGLAGGTRVVTNEMRILEGAMPIRAAAQFLSQMQGINAVMGAVFPIFGFIALVGVLDTILDKTGLLPKKWDEVTEAQKESYKVMDQQGKKLDELLGKLKKLQDEKRYDDYEAKYGKDARRQLEALDKQAEVGGLDHQQVEMLRQQVDVLRKMADPYGAGATVGTTQWGAKYRAGYVPDDKAAFQANMAGMGETSLWGLSNTQAQAGSMASVDRAKALLPEYEARLNTALAQKEVDQGSVNKSQADLLRDEKRKDDEEAKKAAEEFTRVLNAAADAVGKRDEAYVTRLINGADTLYQQSHPDVFEQNQGFDTPIARRSMQNMLNGALVTDVNRHRNPWAQDEEVSSWWTGVQATNKTSDQRKLSTVDQQAQHDRVGMDPKAALDNTLATLDAELKIKSIHQDIWDMDKERFDAGLKASQAEFEYEQKIAALKKQDLEEYARLADGLFGAIHGHTTNQWGKDFALGQEKQVFANVAQYPLQQIGHILGGAIPGQVDASGNKTAIGSLLSGTIFDAKNKGVSDAATTAKETKRTADEVHALRGDIRAMGGAPSPASATDGGSGLYNLPSTSALSNPLSVFGSDINGWTGSGGGSSTLGAGPGIGTSLLGAGGLLAQFMGGTSGGPSVALGRLLGVTPPSGTVGYGSDGTPHDQYGNPITTSAATKVGEGVTVGAAVMAGTMQAIKDFSQGGAAGGLKGAGDVLGMASMIPGPQQPFVAAAAAITSMIGGMLTTGPAQRSKDIFNALSSNQYLAPTALNVTQGMNGTYEDFDARGNLRTSNFSAVPTVAEPYITSQVVNGQRTYYNAPGEVTAPFSNPTKSPAPPAPGGTTVIINGGVQAMDSESFHAFVSKTGNSNAIGEAVTAHLQNGNGERLASQIRYHANG